MLLTAVHNDDNEITNDSVVIVTYHLQHSTEQSKDERVNEWMLFNFKYRFHDLQCLQCLDAVGWAAGRASGL